MTAEAVEQQGTPENNPVQVARKQFNQALFDSQYDSARLIGASIHLQNSLLKSELSPEKIYHELSIVAGQAADLAESHQDQASVVVLREMQQGFELTYENFRPKSETEPKQPVATPTNLDTLPPMTTPKGPTNTSAKAEAKTDAPNEGVSAYATNDERLLKALRDSKDKVLTRAELAAQSGMSEASVTTYLSKLRTAGHTIESVKEGNKVVGYKIIEPEPDSESKTADQS